MAQHSGLPQNTLQVTDREGWQRTYSLEKNLIYIGSAAENDIVLDARRGGGVAARHLQLIPGASGSLGYRLINLSDQPIPVGEAGEQVVQPRSYLEVMDGQQLAVGEFVLAFYSAPSAYPLGIGYGGTGTSPQGVRQPAMAGNVVAGTSPQGEQAASQGIGLGLTLQGTELWPERPLEGRVTVRNLGEAVGVQFKVVLEGLEAECYDLEPGPILFPHAEAALLLRLYHPRKPAPAAGRRRITIQATAPEAYPGERATVSKIIDIVPFFSHKLRLEAVSG